MYWLQAQERTSEAVEEFRLAARGTLSTPERRYLLRRAALIERRTELPSSGSGLLDGLETKGLVARHADAGDRRRNVLELTGDWHTALARAVRASDEAERQLLAELDDDESAQLRTLLTRLARDRSER